jgi:hypothetical protein
MLLLTHHQLLLLLLVSVPLLVAFRRIPVGSCRGPAVFQGVQELNCICLKAWDTHLPQPEEWSSLRAAARRPAGVAAAGTLPRMNEAVLPQGRDTPLCSWLAGGNA